MSDYAAMMEKAALADQAMAEGLIPQDYALKPTPPEVQPVGAPEAPKPAAEPAVPHPAPSSVSSGTRRA